MGANQWGRNESRGNGGVIYYSSPALADNGVSPWVEVLAMKDARNAVGDVEKRIRYQYLLTRDAG